MKKTIAFMLLGVSAEVAGFLISILSGQLGVYIWISQDIQLV